MVDRVIKKKKWSTKRLLTIGGITALVLLAFGSYYFTSGKSRLNVDLDRITIATVTKGPFQETIPVNGVVLPITSIYLDATEGGRVEEKYVEDGTVMKKGEPILTVIQYGPRTQSRQSADVSIYPVVKYAPFQRNSPAKYGKQADQPGRR